MTRLKILLLIICSVLISGVMGYKDYQQWDPLYFVIEMESSANGTAQIFFNTGHGFREQHSRGLKVTHRGFQKYSFPVAASIESIRFDPINKPSILSIKNAGLENAVGDKLKLFPAQSFRAAKHINKMDVNEGVLTIHTEENSTDPILLIDNSSFHDKSRWLDHLTERGWIYIGYALFIFAIFMGLGRFGQYLERSSTHRELFLQLSINSVVLISVYLFYAVMTIYALLVFKQFQWSEVLSVSLVFLLLLHILLYVFHSDLFRQSLSVSIYNLLMAGLVVFFLMLLVGSPNTMFEGNYFRTFPLLEMELGLGWHRDTAYHVSLIQSILNFGYPSIGQHGSPVTIYHVLSHYIDALVVLLTGVEPFDSYGLLYNFKKFFVLAAITVFLSKLVNDKQPVTFLVVLILAAPIIIESWHCIASHSLWFTSMVLILSTSKVFGLIIKPEKISLKEILVVLIIVMLLALGKVSTSFMYAVFLGFYLLLKQPRSYIPYLFGAACLLFFYVYSSLFSSRSSGMLFSHIGIAGFYKFLMEPSRFWLSQLYSTYASVLIFICVSLVYKSSNNIRFLFASILSLLVLYLVTTITLGLSRADIFYFVNGLSSILILFALHSFFFCLKNGERRNFEVIDFLDRKAVFILVAGLGAVLTHLPSIGIFSRTPQFPHSISIFSMTPKNLASKLDKLIISPFSNVNKSEDLKNNVTIAGHLPATLDRPWLSFRNELNAYLKLHGLKKSDALLFVPKEIFDGNVDGRPWARGMLVYAVAGVPLVYGLGGMDQTYGQSDYNRAALRRYKTDFNAAEACKVGSGKAVISVQDFENPDFELYKCSV